MNLDLGILWIENSFSKQEEDALKRRVQEAGFIARIETIPNGNGIAELGRRHRLYHNYDIILLDYRLKDENGDELAPTIRTHFPSITILFYSGSASDSDLRQLIAAKNVEGVYCCSRSGFIERAGTLIDQTARSLDRLSGMRGLAMRVVAECDELMKTAILSMSKRDADCAGKVSELDDEVIKSLEAFRKQYEASTEGDLSSRLDTRAVDSAKLFKHFRRLTKAVATSPAAFSLADVQVEELRGLRQSSAQYMEQVLGKRNVLGHVIEVQGATGWVLKGSDEISINDFPDIRREFALHIDAIRKISDLVTALDEEQAA